MNKINAVPMSLTPVYDFPVYDTAMLVSDNRFLIPIFKPLIIVISFRASPKDADQNASAKMTYELKPSGVFYQGNKCQNIGLAPVGV